MPGSVNWITHPQRRVIYLHHGDSLNAVEEFVTFLLTYSTAGVEKISQTDILRPEIPERPGGPYGNVDWYAKIIMKCLENGQIYTLPVVAPIESMFEDAEGGLRVKQAIGEQITAEYANLSGKPFEFRYGWLKGEK